MAEDKSVSELMKAFVEQLMLYLRQRGRETVGYVLVQPLQKAGLKVALLLTATALMILGAVFLGVFAVIGFAYLFGGSYECGYLCAGLLVMAVAVVLVMVALRVGKEERRDDSTSGRTGEADHGAGSTD